MVCQGANGQRVRPYCMSSALGSLGRELVFGEYSAKDFEINLEAVVTDIVEHFTFFFLQKPLDVFQTSLQKAKHSLILMITAGARLKYSSLHGKHRCIHKR